MCRFTAGLSVWLWKAFVLGLIVLAVMVWLGLRFFKEQERKIGEYIKRMKKGG
jgi:hypothetical protein